MSAEHQPTAREAVWCADCGPVSPEHADVHDEHHSRPAPVASAPEVRLSELLERTDEIEGTVLKVLDGDEVWLHTRQQVEQWLRALAEEDHDA